MRKLLLISLALMLTACSEEKNDYGWINPSTDFSTKAISEKDVNNQGCTFHSTSREVICKTAQDSNHAFMQKVALLNWQADHINWLRSLNTRTYKKPMNPHSLNILLEKSKKVTAYVNSDFARNLDNIYRSRALLSLTERSQMFVLDFIGASGIRANTNTNPWSFSCETCSDSHYLAAEKTLDHLVETYEKLEASDEEKEVASGLIASARAFLDQRNKE